VVLDERFEDAPSLWGWTRRRRSLGGAAASAAAATLTAVAAIGEWTDAPAAIDPPPPPILRVDPNVAPSETLAVLPRLGPTLVSRIVAAREERPIESIGELSARVRGIGKVTALAVKPHLLFGGEDGPR
jgi:competence protein ComEA